MGDKAFFRKQPFFFLLGLRTRGISRTGGGGLVASRSFPPHNLASVLLFADLMGLFKEINRGRGRSEFLSPFADLLHSFCAHVTLPGHLLSLQRLCSPLSPGQASPPKKGPSHTRCLCWTPPPQVLLQLLQVVQACQCPSTEKNQPAVNTMSSGPQTSLE